MILIQQSSKLQKEEEVNSAKESLQERELIIKRHECKLKRQEEDLALTKQEHLDKEEEYQVGKFLVVIKCFLLFDMPNTNRSLFLRRKQSATIN